MKSLLPLFLPLLALLPPTTPLRITSATHSGPGCPQQTNLTLTGPATSLRIHLPGFSTLVGTAQTTSCQIHLTLADGAPRQRLVLEDVSVWGGLSLAAGAEAEFYTTAYWSEDAAAQVVRKTGATAAAAGGALEENVKVRAEVVLGSACVGADGYVGILNVGFRVVSKEGKVGFGVQRGEEGETWPVMEHLGMYWEDC